MRSRTLRMDAVPRKRKLAERLTGRWFLYLKKIRLEIEYTAKSLLCPTDASIGKASFFMATGCPPKKVGRRDAGRTHQQADAPHHLLAEFSLSPAS